MDAARRDVADRMAEAALAWLDSLDALQRRAAVGAAPADDASDEERRRWFHTPTDHGGLTVHAQQPAQQRGAMRLVATAYSVWRDPTSDFGLDTPGMHRSRPHRGDVAAGPDPRPGRSGYS